MEARINDGQTSFLEYMHAEMCEMGMGIVTFALSRAASISKWHALLEMNLHAAKICFNLIGPCS